MVDKNIVIEYYGIDPPEGSKLYWGDGDSFDEEKTIFNLDLKASLKKLNPTEKKILTLCNQGYSIREIENIINLPRATVQDTKDRALNKLKEMMNGEDNIGEIWK